MPIDFGSSNANTFYLKPYEDSLIMDLGPNYKPKDGEDVLVRPHKTHGTTYYRKVRNVEGLIDDISIQRSTIKVAGEDIELENLVMVIKDFDGAVFNIQMSWNTTAANSIMWLIGDDEYPSPINVQLPVKVWAKEYNGKTYISVLQQNKNGEWKMLKSPWPKECDKIPLMEKIIVNRKEVWDSSARQEFFEACLQRWRSVNLLITPTNTFPVNKEPMRNPVMEEALKPKSSGDPEFDALLDSTPGGVHPAFQSDYDIRSKESQLPKGSPGRKRPPIG